MRCEDREKLFLSLLSKLSGHGIEDFLLEEMAWGWRAELRKENEVRQRSMTCFSSFLRECCWRGRCTLNVIAAGRKVCIQGSWFTVCGFQWKFKTDTVFLQVGWNRNLWSRNLSWNQPVFSATTMLGGKSCVILTMVQQLLRCFSRFLSAILLPPWVCRNACFYSTAEVPSMCDVGNPGFLGSFPCELLAWLSFKTC